MPQPAQPAPAYTEASGVLTLSAEDVSRLLNDTSHGTRVDMTHKIAGAYNTKGLNAREVQVAEQIFRLLMRDTEVKVRASLAEHVKDSTAIPRDIVMKLARDVEEVSLPVLQFSEVLSDDDLAELIESTEQVTRYLAISSRKQVSDAVVDKLIAKGKDEVAAALVKNEGAAISEEGYDKILNLHRSNETLMQSLSDRPKLPVGTVNKMVQVVSSTLAERIKQKNRAPAENIDLEVEKAQETETLRLVSHAASDDEIDKLLNQLIVYKRLSPSILLTALAQGSFNFFEMGLAKLAKVPVVNARKLINDRGDLGFRGIYNKSGLPEAMFPAVKLLLRVVHELDESGEKTVGGRYANHIVEKILQYADESPVENLSYIIALVRRSAQ